MPVPFDVTGLLTVWASSAILASFFGATRM
jgi:hypothetical protein